MNDPCFVFSHGEPIALQLRNRGGSQNCLIFVTLCAISWFENTICCMETGLANKHQLEFKECFKSEIISNFFLIYEDHKLLGKTGALVSSPLLVINDSLKISLSYDVQWSLYNKWPHIWWIYPSQVEIPSVSEDGHMSEQGLSKQKQRKNIWKVKGLDSSLTLYPSGKDKSLTHL